MRKFGKLPKIKEGKDIKFNINFKLKKAFYKIRNKKLENFQNSR